MPAVITAPADRFTHACAKNISVSIKIKEFLTFYALFIKYLFYPKILPMIFIS